jgi:hypothetical protein
MGYKQLTQKGKEYIRKTITNNGNKTFTGKNKYAVIGTTIPQGTDIVSKAYDDSGNQTTDAAKFAELVIKWVDQYSKQYEIDANILSAQQNQESRFLPWNYSPSGAIGFTQFTVTTIVEWIFKNKKVSQSEIDTLSNGINGDLTKTSTFFTSNSQSQVYNQIRLENKTKLFQNVVDNPKIMIHAQASLMAYISNRNNKIASSTLFAYNRGSGLSSTSYTEVVSKLANMFLNKEKQKKYGRDYTKEGLGYVSNIFKLLNKEYGYNLDLNVNDAATKEVNIRTQNS